MLDITQESTSKFATTARGDIHYNEVGDGLPIIFLHGSGPGATGWSNFNKNMAVLGEKYRCIAPDMPGWGQSYAVGLEERRHAETLIDFMDVLGISKAAVIGNSMGGATSIRFAAMFPDRITHLVTMGSGAGGTRLFGFGDGPSEGLKVLWKGYRDPSPETMRELVEIMTFDKSNASEELVQQRSANARARQDHLDNFIEGIGKPRFPFVTDAELAAISAPTMLIHGRDDRVVHYENTLYLTTLIPNSRAVLINRCGHWAQVEHPAEFNSLVDNFLTNTPA